MEKNCRILLPKPQTNNCSETQVSKDFKTRKMDKKNSCITSRRNTWRIASCLLLLLQPPPLSQPPGYPLQQPIAAPAAPAAAPALTSICSCYHQRHCSFCYSSHFLLLLTLHTALVAATVAFGAYYSSIITSSTSCRRHCHSHLLSPFNK
ncbi:uncharacterized protein LOC110036491 [Phalaenopsis equestris]|uniref:uncharacterized protein LOC110036491 n=1 Tax=Phalaenopsis equestris TaxID=78828 RepID=UPI0009E62E77|nr:uncharacterized protein LOC110036491 [Phalaenopsis equestris]